jgi:hypothetical protein
MGLHRLPNESADQAAPEKRLIFWSVYTLKQGSAFDFGITSTMPTYGVATSRPYLEKDMPGLVGR